MSYVPIGDQSLQWQPWTWLARDWILLWEHGLGGGMWCVGWDYVLCSCWEQSQILVQEYHFKLVLLSIHLYLCVFIWKVDCKVIVIHLNLFVYICSMNNVSVPQFPHMLPTITSILGLISRCARNWFKQYCFHSPLQVFHWLWHVPLLHSSHWTWLEGGNWAIQVHWALLGISRQAKATMANFSCTSSTWLFIWCQLCRRRIIWGTNGEGEPAKALAEIQGGHCCVWPCAQLWKDMPHIPGSLITLCSDKDVPYPYPHLSAASCSNMEGNMIFFFWRNYGIFIVPLHLSQVVSQ